MGNNNYVNQQRLENIKSLKPMLASLRTISLSNWRLALKKLQYLEAYMQEFNLLADDFSKIYLNQGSKPETEPVTFILGSTRGLCGGFNRDLVDFFDKQPEDNQLSSSRTMLFGEKLKTLFTRRHIDYSMFFEYPKINALNFQYISDMLAKIGFPESHKNLKLVYNAYSGAGKFRPVVRDFVLSQNSIEMKKDVQSDEILIDSDPKELIAFINKYIFTISIYKAFLSSLAAEHSSRFQIMDNAITNTDDLVQELTIMVQIERRKKVTSEMQELSIGAGLLKKTTSN